MARFLSTVAVNGESARLGEIPTKITYTPQWPYSRYTEPAGGRFIRECGQTGPLPEALTELRLAEIESPPARAYLDGAYVEKSPQLSPHEWGATTRPMGEAERERLAAFGRGIEVGRVNRLTVESQITGTSQPGSVNPDTQFIITVDILTVGTDCDKQFIVFFDPIVGNVGAGISDVCLPPGSAGTWTCTFNPLNDWYPSTIPDTLNWTARVGYVTAEYPDGSFDGIVTDERQLPGISVGAPSCVAITSEAECIAAGCHWYEGSCHSSPLPPSNWWDKYKYYMIGASAAAIVGVTVVVAKRR